MWPQTAKNIKCIVSGRKRSQYEPVHSTGLLSQSEKQMGGESREEGVNTSQLEIMFTHDSLLNLRTVNAAHAQQRANQLARLA